MPKRHDAPELLKLLNARWDEEISKLPDLYRAPKWNAKDVANIEVAAQEHAEANPSDPFAYGRMKLHLTRGLDAAGPVLKDAMRLNAQRRHRARQEGEAHVA